MCVGAVVGLPFAYVWTRHLVDELGYLASPAVWRYDENCTTRVPKIVHMTGLHLPEHVEKVTMQWAPGWKLQFADDDAARRTLATRCGQEYADAFDCMAAGAYKADIYRMCALYAHMR